jgi:hypothetical protein
VLRYKSQQPLGNNPFLYFNTRTPKTILETQSHSKYLQGRIRNHKSSSPGSIIEAVKYFEKGQSILLHKIALQEAEIRELRQANEMLSRRRSAKRTRLQRRGDMTIGEAQEIINQADVDMQIIGESSRKAGDQLNSITHLVDKRSTSEPCERARPIKHTVPPLLQLNQHPRLS